MTSRVANGRGRAGRRPRRRWPRRGPGEHIPRLPLERVERALMGEQIVLPGEIVEPLTQIDPAGEAGDLIIGKADVWDRKLGIVGVAVDRERLMGRAEVSGAEVRN